MERVANGVLLTDKEASMIKDALSIGANMKASPFEDYLYWDWEHECNNASAMFNAMERIGVL